MPPKNYFIEQITNDTPVFLRGNENKYYVAVINGEEGVVSWSSQNAYLAQRILNRLVLQTARKINKMSVDGLLPFVAARGTTWAAITETDPESVDPPSQAEISMVREFLIGDIKEIIPEHSFYKY